MLRVPRPVVESTDSTFSRHFLGFASSILRRLRDQSFAKVRADIIGHARINM